MTGLKRYDRDPGLPERLGEPRLTAPDPAQVVAWLRAGALGAGGAGANAATLEFARWKPGVSLTCVFAVELVDGALDLCALKRYSTDKANHLAEREAARVEPDDDQEAIDAHGMRLAGRAFGDRETMLWAPRDDRELPGFARAADARSAARWIEEAGLVPPRSIRRRRTVHTLLRYKPERRAVLRLDLSLRAPAVHTNGRARASYAVRVLPLDAAARTIEARRALARVAPDAPIVPLALALPERGVAVEPWLDVETFADDEFGHAEAAGRALAALHAAPTPPAEVASVPRRDGAQGSDGDRELLRRVGVRTDAIPFAPPAPASAWTHGDLHPDQVALDADGAPLLLDLDELGLGDPTRDLASWIADHLAHDSGIELGAASAALLAGYRAGGGAPVDPAELARLVADELLRRAAGAVRRLEAGAVARARGLVERAARVAGVARVGDCPDAGPARPTFADALARLPAVGARPADVARADVSRDGELVLTLSPPASSESDGRERWLRCLSGGLVELAPRDDERLPLAARLRAPGAERLRVLSWRPGRRIVLQNGEEVLKGHREKRLDAAVRAHATAARVNARGGFVVPRLREVIRDESALSLELLLGRHPAASDTDAPIFAEVGACLRAMQTASATGLERFDARAEIAVLERWRERLALVGVAPTAGWDAAAARAIEAARALPDAEPASCHRDLHDGQLVALARGGIGLLDFDLLCAADPVLDAANLVAHLDLRALQGLPGADARGAERCGEALLLGFGRSREPGFDARFAFYRATALLRLALVYALRPRWKCLLPDLVHRAEQALTLTLHGAGS